MESKRLAAGWDAIFGALGVRGQANVRRRVDAAITDDGRLRLERSANALDPANLAIVPTTQVETGGPTAVSTAANLENRLHDLSDTVVDVTPAGGTTASIIVTATPTIAGTEITADAVFGTGAGVVAEGNHTHAYVPTSKVLTATATLDFPSIGGGSCSDLTITVTGAAVNDAVVLGPPAAGPGDVTAIGFVSAADTVTIRLCNATGAGIDPASASWRATVLKP